MRKRFWLRVVAVLAVVAVAAPGWILAAHSLEDRAKARASERAKRQLLDGIAAALNGTNAEPESRAAKRGGKWVEEQRGWDAERVVEWVAEQEATKRAVSEAIADHVLEQYPGASLGEIEPEKHWFFDEWSADFDITLPTGETDTLSAKAKQFGDAWFVALE